MKLLAFFWWIWFCFVRIFSPGSIPGRGTLGPEHPGVSATTMQRKDRKRDRRLFGFSLQRGRLTSGRERELRVYSR